MAIAPEERLLAELAAAGTDDLALTEAEYTDPSEFASAVVNNLPAIAYALNAGLPVTKWAPLKRNPGEEQRVLRAVRQWGEQARIILIDFITGQIDGKALVDRLMAAYAQHARNAYIAGRRAVGDLAPLSAAAEAKLAALVGPDQQRLADYVNGPPPTTGAGSSDPTAVQVGGGGLAAALQQMFSPSAIFTPSNFLGSGLPGDPFKNLPPPLGAGGHKPHVKPGTLLRPGETIAGPAPEIDALAADTRMAASDAMGGILRRFDQIGQAIGALSGQGNLDAVTDTIPAESVMVWWVLGDADHCIDCVRLSEDSPYFADQFDAEGIAPGSGHTRCGDNCACDLEFDVPSEVCLDPMSDPGTLGATDLGSVDLGESSDGRRVNVWIQEADACGNPQSIDAFAAAAGLLGDFGIDPFSWDGDVASAITEGEDVAFDDLSAQTQTAFAFLADVAPGGTAALRATTYRLGTTEYTAIWQRAAGAIRFEAGTTTAGLGALDPEMTLRAIRDLTAIADREQMRFEVNGATANTGMMRWLDTLGAEHAGVGGSLPARTPAFEQLDSLAVMAQPRESDIGFVAPSQAVDTMRVQMPEIGTGAKYNPAMGANPKVLLADDSGQGWLVKYMADAGDPTGDARALPEIIGTQVHEILNAHVAPVGATTHFGRSGTVQRILQDATVLAKSGKTIHELAAADQRELMREAVIDRLIENTDAHLGNWLLTPDGLVGIDKGMAWWNLPKTADRAMSENEVSVIADWGRQIPSDIWRNVTPADVEAAIAKVEVWPTDSYMGFVERAIPGLKAGGPKGVRTAEWRRLMRARKESIRADVEGFFDVKARATLPENLTPEWQHFLDTGELVPPKAGAAPGRLSDKGGPDLGRTNEPDLWLARDPAGADATGGLRTAADIASVEDLHAFATLPVEDANAFYYTHAVGDPSVIDKAITEGLRPNAAGNIYTSHGLVRDKGTGFVVIRVPKGEAQPVRGIDVVAEGLTYVEYVFDRPIKPSEIVRVVRQVKDTTAPNFSIREDQLARYASTHQGAAAAEIKGLAPEYQMWFSEAPKAAVPPVLPALIEPRPTYVLPEVDALPAWPDMGLLKVSPATKGLAGANPKKLLVDPSGREWLFKAGGTAERSEGDVAAAELARRMGLRVPPVQQVTWDGVAGTLQPIVANAKALDRLMDKGQIAAEVVDPEGMREIARQSVLDFVLANNDTHGGNFVISEGQVWGIDKGRSYVGGVIASMNPAGFFNPTGGMGTLMGGAIRFPERSHIWTRLRPADMVEAFNRLDGISAQEFGRISGPVLPHIANPFGTPEQSLEVLLQRKAGARARYEQWFRTELDTAPGDVSPEWRAWRKAGGTFDVAPVAPAGQPARILPAPSAAAPLPSGIASTATFTSKATSDIGVLPAGYVPATAGKDAATRLAAVMPNLSNNALSSFTLSQLNFVIARAESMAKQGVDMGMIRRLGDFTLVPEADRKLGIGLTYKGERVALNHDFKWAFRDGAANPDTVYNDIGGLFAHEYGHVAFAHLGSEQQAKVLALYKAHAADAAKDLSAYAAKDADEWVGEMMARITTPGYTPGTVAYDGEFWTAMVADGAAKAPAVGGAPALVKKVDQPNPFGQQKVWQAPPVKSPSPSTAFTVKQGDAQQYLLPDNALPVNAPAAQWTGYVPPEPPLPDVAATPGIYDAAKKARNAVIGTHDWHAVVAGKQPVAFTFDKGASADAAKAGLHVEKVGSMFVTAHGEADIEPLRAFVAAGGDVNSDEFWHLAGWSDSDLATYDAYDTLKAEKKLRLTAGVVIAEPDGRLWVLAPKNQYAGYEHTWIKGGVDAGETTAQAAVREVMEEAGFSVELDHYLGDYVNSDKSGIARMYVGHRTGGGPLWAHADETYAVRLATPDDLKGMLIRYGKPDSRDQQILGEAAASLSGKPALDQLVVPPGDAGTLSDKLSPEPNTWWPGPAKPKAAIAPEPPLSTSFGYDPNTWKSFTPTTLPPSAKFPYSRTVWTLADGTQQPMYWQVDSAKGQLFWANSKKQIADPHQRLNLHVAQIVTMADTLAADPTLALMRVNGALLDQVQGLRDLLIAGGGKTIKTASGEQLEIDSANVLKLAESIKANAPIAKAAGVVSATPPNVVAGLTGKYGVDPDALGSFMKSGAYLGDIGPTFTSAQVIEFSDGLTTGWSQNAKGLVTLFGPGAGWATPAMRDVALVGSLTHLAAVLPTLPTEATAVRLARTTWGDIDEIAAKLGAYAKIGADPGADEWLVSPTLLNNIAAEAKTEMAAVGHVPDLLTFTMPGSAVPTPPLSGLYNPKRVAELSLAHSTLLTEPLGHEVQGSKYLWGFVPHPSLPNEETMRFNGVAAKGAHPLEGLLSILGNNADEIYQGAVYTYGFSQRVLDATPGLSEILTSYGAKPQPGFALWLDEGQSATISKAMAAGDIGPGAIVVEAVTPPAELAFPDLADNVKYPKKHPPGEPPEGPGVMSLAERTAYYGLNTTTAQTVAFAAYRKTGYHTINNLLRKGEFVDSAAFPTEAAAKNAIAAMDELVSLKPIGEDIVVYRDMLGGEAFDLAAPTEPLALNHALQAQTLSDLKAQIGQTFHDPSFMSTAIAADRWQYPVKMQLRVPAGTKGWYKGGGETELLLARDTHYKVLDVSERTIYTNGEWKKQIVVKAEVVQAGPTATAALPAAVAAIVTPASAAPTIDALAALTEMKVTSGGIPLVKSGSADGNFLWRRLGNDLELHTVDPDMVTAAIVRFGKAAHDAPKITALRIKAAAWATLSTEQKSLVVQAGGKIATSGTVTLPRENLLLLRDQVMEDLKAAAIPEPVAPVAVLLPKLGVDPAEAKSLTAAIIPQKQGFEKIEWSDPSWPGPVAIRQRNLSDTIVWSGVSGGTEAQKLTAGIRHLSRMADQIDGDSLKLQIRVEALDKMPASWTAFLTEHGGYIVNAPGKDPVLFLKREDALALRDAIEPEMAGHGTVAAAVASVPAAPPLPSLPEMLTVDPAAVKALAVPELVAESPNNWTRTWSNGVTTYVALTDTDALRLAGAVGNVGVGERRIAVLAELAHLGATGKTVEIGPAALMGAWGQNLKAALIEAGAGNPETDLLVLDPALAAKVRSAILDNTQLEDALTPIGTPKVAPDTSGGSLAAQLGYDKADLLNSGLSFNSDTVADGAGVFAITVPTEQHTWFVDFTVDSEGVVHVTIPPSAGPPAFKQSDATMATLVLLQHVSGAAEADGLILDGEIAQPIRDFLAAQGWAGTETSFFMTKKDLDGIVTAIESDTPAGKIVAGSAAIPPVLPTDPWDIAGVSPSEAAAASTGALADTANVPTQFANGNFQSVYSIGPTGAIWLDASTAGMLVPEAQATATAFLMDLIAGAHLAGSPFVLIDKAAADGYKTSSVGKLLKAYGAEEDNNVYRLSADKADKLASDAAAAGGYTPAMPPPPAPPIAPALPTHVPTWPTTYGFSKSAVEAFPTPLVTPKPQGFVDVEWAGIGKMRYRQSTTTITVTQMVKDASVASDAFVAGIRHVGDVLDASPGIKTVRVQYDQIPDSLKMQMLANEGAASIDATYATMTRENFLDLRDGLNKDLGGSGVSAGVTPAKFAVGDKVKVSTAPNGDTFVISAYDPLTGKASLVYEDIPGMNSITGISDTLLVPAGAATPTGIPVPVAPTPPRALFQKYGVDEQQLAQYVNDNPGPWQPWSKKYNSGYVDNNVTPEKVTYYAGGPEYPKMTVIGDVSPQITIRGRKFAAHWTVDAVNYGTNEQQLAALYLHIQKMADASNGLVPIFVDSIITDQHPSLLKMLTDAGAKEKMTAQLPGGWDLDKKAVAKLKAAMDAGSAPTPIPMPSPTLLSKAGDLVTGTNLEVGDVITGPNGGTKYKVIKVNHAAGTIKINNGSTTEYGVDAFFGTPGNHWTIDSKGAQALPPPVAPVAPTPVPVTPAPVPIPVTPPPAPVPTGPIGVTSTAVPGTIPGPATAPASVTPSFLYGYDPNVVATGKGIDLGEVPYGTGAAAGPKKVTGVGQVKAYWSIAPRADRVGLFGLEAPATATNAEIRDAAFLMLRQVAEVGSTTPKGFFIRPEFYTRVEGLKQIMLDAGGTETQWPNLGDVIAMKADAAQKLADALKTDTMGPIKTGIQSTSEFLGFDKAGASMAFKATPTIAAKTGVFTWPLALGKPEVTVQAEAGFKTATISAVKGTDVTTPLAVAAQINWLADQGATELRVAKDVIDTLPRLRPWLLAVGGRIDSGYVVLDEVALGNAARHLGKDALPVALGGAPLPYSVFDALHAQAADVASAATSHVIDVTGPMSASRLTLSATSTVTTRWSKTATNIYWQSVDRGAATVGQTRAAVAAQLRAFTQAAAQNVGIERLDVALSVLADQPGLRAVLLRYGGTEVPAAGDREAYVTVSRARLIQMRKDIDAEFDQVGAGGMLGGQQAMVIAWPSADDLAYDAARTGKLAGQTSKGLYIDKQGNEWLFKPGRGTGYGPITDEATSELARTLGLPVPPIRRYTLHFNGQTVEGSLQKMMPAQPLRDVKDLTPAQTEEMLRHSVLDWVINNDDAHVGNWLVGADGKLWSIDKSRAWTTFDGPADKLFNGNAGNGYKPLMFDFFTKARADPGMWSKIHPQSVAPTLRALNGMDEATFRRIVKPVADAAFQPRWQGKPDALLARMVDRKNSAVGDFEAYFKGEVDAAIKANPASVPAEWKAWATAGGHFNLTATPEDLWREDWAALRSRFLPSGQWSPAEYRRVVAAHQSTATKIIGEFVGPGLARYQGTAGVKGVAPLGSYAANYIPLLIPQQAYAEWQDIQRWAMYEILNGGAPLKNDGHLLNDFRQMWDPAKGTLRLIRGEGTGYAPNHRAGYAAWQKEGVRVAFSSSHVDPPWGQYFFHFEIPLSQVVSTQFTEINSTSEREILVRDVRADQLYYVGPRKLSKSEQLNYTGAILAP